MTAIHLCCRRCDKPMKAAYIADVCNRCARASADAGWRPIHGEVSGA